MRKLSAILLILVLMLSLSTPALAARSIVSDATGYTCGADVEYVIVSSTVVNWGARGENCTFLTTYAESCYTGDYSWETISALAGGSGTEDAYNSALYEALRNMMESNHETIQGYQDTRQYYQYTDCVGSDYSKISSFYSGKLVNGTWNGTTYNREHIWPKSKCINQSKQQDSADIMMLRPTISSENSSRGNKAYGESSGYFDPGTDVRGDCARMVLYGYVRWGNTGKMWGTSGVMESLEILLKWMEEDPVDTWEMGRNDSVESITGVRNVFVDYPEYAWLLFGQDIPDDMVTPSGEAMEEEIPACTHGNTEVRNGIAATCGADGYTGDTYCSDCGQLLKNGEIIPATGEHILDASGNCTDCDYYEAPPACQHENTTVLLYKEPTCVEDGFSGSITCNSCGALLDPGHTLPATGEHTLDETGHCTGCDYFECQHENTEHRGQSEATCVTDGHTGDVYCADCSDFIAGGSVIPATGEHTFGEWVSNEDLSCRECTVCGHEEVESIDDPVSVSNWSVVAIAAAVVIVLAGGVLVLIIILKRRK